MHYAEFAEDESQALLNAIKEYENNKWKVIGQKVGKPAKACEQYAKEHFPGMRCSTNLFHRKRLLTFVRVFRNFCIVVQESLEEKLREAVHFVAVALFFFLVLFYFFGL